MSLSGFELDNFDCLKCTNLCRVKFTTVVGVCVCVCVCVWQRRGVAEGTERVLCVTRFRSENLSTVML